MQILPILGLKYSTAVLKNRENFIIMRISDLTEISRVTAAIKVFAPLSEFRHLKRIRIVKPVKPNEHSSSSTEETHQQAEVIVCTADSETARLLALLQKNKISLSVFFRRCFCETNHGLELTTLVDKLSDPRIVSICVEPPLTRDQYNEMQKDWPVVFHEDKVTAAFLNGKAFDQEQRQFIKTCAELISTAYPTTEGDALLPPICSNVALIASEKRIYTIAHSFKHSALSHAVIIAISDIALKMSGKEQIVGKRPGCHAECNVCRLHEGCKFDTSNDDSDLTYLCTGLDIYMSHEPCMMCAAALVHSRIRYAFYLEPRATGVLGSQINLHLNESINHRYKAFRIKL